MADRDWCDHCGRTDTVVAAMVAGGAKVRLCHAERDGRTSNPDCYHLVTTCAEKLGARLDWPHGWG